VTAVYEQTLLAGWADMDFNGHMRNTAYLDKSADVRMMFFADHGFPVREFARLRIGPVIMKDQLEYFRELSLLESVRVRLSLAGLSEDGSRFELINEFRRGDDKVVARVASTGGWLDLNERRLIAPPPLLDAAMRSLPRTAEFGSLPSSLK